MRKIKFLPVLLTAAVIALSSVTTPTPAVAGVNIQINGFLPAPPGVIIYGQSSERPYYVRHNRRVYMERDRNHRRWKKEQKHNRHDQGRDRGHEGDRRR